MKVTVWNEYYHEKKEEAIRKVYPEGIHGQIAAFLSKDPEIEVRTATLEEPEHGLTEEVLNDTDVLLWWGHVAHGRVSDEVVKRVKDHVLRGMGLIVLHSAHASKIFGALMGTSCTLKWREGDKERVWCAEPGHPIAKGIPEQFVLEEEEMYGEPFDIPTPDHTVFISWFKGGEVCRSGCTFTRGLGKIFYFRPGHEAFPTYYNENVIKILTNAVHWACPTAKSEKLDCPFVEPLEK